MPLSFASIVGGLTAEGGEGAEEEVAPADEPLWQTWVATGILACVVGLAATGTAHISSAGDYRGDQNCGFTDSIHSHTPSSRPRAISMRTRSYTIDTPPPTEGRRPPVSGVRQARRCPEVA